MKEWLYRAQWKVAPALAAGNTAILKPSEVCSVTCLELAAIAHEVGLPAGVFNVVCGYGADAGAPLRCVNPTRARVRGCGLLSAHLFHLL